MRETISATAASEAETRRERFADGTRITRIPAFDPETAIVDETQIARFPDGQRGLFDYRVRAYDPAELVDLARDAGFRHIAVYEDVFGQRWEDGERVVLVACAPV